MFYSSGDFYIKREDLKEKHQEISLGSIVEGDVPSSGMNAYMYTWYSGVYYFVNISAGGRWSDGGTLSVDSRDPITIESLKSEGIFPKFRSDEYKVFGNLQEYMKHHNKVR